MAKPTDELRRSCVVKIRLRPHEAELVRQAAKVARKYQAELVRDLALGGIREAGLVDDSGASKPREVPIG